MGEKMSGPKGLIRGEVRFNVDGRGGVNHSLFQRPVGWFLLVYSSGVVLVLYISLSGSPT